MSLISASLSLNLTNAKKNHDRLDRFSGEDGVDQRKAINASLKRAYMSLTSGRLSPSLGTSRGKVNHLLGSLVAIPPEPHTFDAVFVSPRLYREKAPVGWTCRQAAIH